MRSKNLLFGVVFLTILLIGVVSAACGDNGKHGVKIDGWCYDCGGSDSVCPINYGADCFSVGGDPDCGENIYWADSNGLPISSTTITPDVTTIYMTYIGGGIIPGTEVSFEIFEEDIGFDNNIRVTPNDIKGIVDANGNVRANWTVTTEDLAISSDWEQFYFLVNTKQSQNFLNLTLATTPGNPLLGCEQFTTQLTCGGNSDIAKTDFENGNLGDSNDITCGLVGTGCNAINTICSCAWNTTTSTCGAQSAPGDIPGCGATISPPRGICSFDDTTTDDCSDSWLQYSWTKTWAWDVANSFDTGDATNYTFENGKYHWDPATLGKRESAKCRDGSGSRTLPCPAQIQLPFFNIMNVIGAIILIVLIYLIINFKSKKKKSSPKNSKKKRL